VRLAEPVTPPDLTVYNSIYVLDRDGLITATYDKLHLVPFGEYLPFQRLLESLGLQQLTKQRGGFSAGDRRRLLLIPGAPPAVPLICYEIIFPGEVGAQAALQGDGQSGGKAARPGWMINVTNDGWFGISSGPYQHFQQARVRAIEAGLPLVRAANTGISAVVDPLGRVIEKLPLGVEGAIDARLPQPIAAPPYTRVGDLPAGMMVAIALLLLLHGRLQPKALKPEGRSSIDYS
jgi:apolipoprotein N-acyltransferase